jgi:hypothetical protein
MQNEISPLLTDREVERILRVGKGWCAKDRLARGRIPHVRLGRSCRYRLTDVMAFVESSIRNSTSEAA